MIGDDETIAGQNKETLDNEWKMVSRHENTRKRLAKIGADRARELAQSDYCSLDPINKLREKVEITSHNFKDRNYQTSIFIATASGYYSIIPQFFRPS
jgi:hypothetical protein